MNHSTATLFVVALCAWLSPVWSAEPLRWKFETGARWRVTIDQQATWQTTIGGKAVPSRLNSQITVLWTTRELRDDGGATIEQQVERVRMTRESAKVATITYDSATKNIPTGDAKLFAAAAKPLLGSSAKLLLSPRGELLEFTLDPATTAELAQLPVASPGRDSKSLDEMFRSSWIPLPEDGIAQGDTWHHSRTIAMAQGSATAKTACTLLSLEDSTAVIDTNTQLEPNEATRNSGAFQLKSHVQTGQLTFDRTVGWPSKQRAHLEIVTTSARKDNVVEVKLDSDTTITFEPLPALAATMP